MPALMRYSDVQTTTNVKLNQNMVNVAIAAPPYKYYLIAEYLLRRERGLVLPSAFALKAGKWKASSILTFEQERP